MTADLLGAPPLTKQLGDHTAEMIVGVDTTSVMTCSSSSGEPMGVEGLIAAASPSVAP